MSVSKALLTALTARDGHVCAYCGIDDDTLVPHHRANRGHGGRKSLDRIANLCFLCSRCNGDAESDADVAASMRDLGIKISSHATPELVPVTRYGTDYWLTSDGRAVPVGEDVTF